MRRHLKNCIKYTRNNGGGNKYSNNIATIKGNETNAFYVALFSFLFYVFHFCFSFLKRRGIYALTAPPAEAAGAADDLAK
jgi:hypothetical protein